jgi:hypothetical protein
LLGTFRLGPEFLPNFLFKPKPGLRGARANQESLLPYY